MPALLLRKLDSGTPVRLLHGMLFPRMREVACPRDPALMGVNGWLPVCLGPCQGRQMLPEGLVDAGLCVWFGDGPRHADAGREGCTEQ